MNALNIFLVILVIEGNVQNIYSTEIDTSLTPSGSEPLEYEPPGDKPETPGSSPDPSTSTPTPITSGTSTATPTPSGSSTAIPTPAPNCEKCFKNSNGMCKKKVLSCAMNVPLVENNIIWESTNVMNCAQQEFEEVKVCNLDCENIFRRGRCPSTLKPVCGYSVKTNMCRKFANSCLLKQDACRYPTIMDWRVTNLIKCQYLMIGGPAGVCM